MKICLLQVGKTEGNYLPDAVDDYCKRLNHYVSFSVETLLNNKRYSEINQQRIAETDLLLAKLTPLDYVVLLDETGKQFTSLEFSQLLEKQMQNSIKRMVFVIGGPFGVDDRLKSKSNLVLSLSKMTFSHQMVRLFFTEQLYRAFTIIKGEKYHHQ